MAFTVDDLPGFLTLLREHPEWRDRVRDEIMAADMRALPGIVRQLGERMDQFGQRVDQLGERLDQLTARVTEIATELGTLSTQVGLLTAEVREGFQNLNGRAGNLEGWRFETKFNARSRVAELIRRPVEIAAGDLEQLLDARDEGTLSLEDWQRLQALDFPFRGRLGKGPDAPEVLVAMEVSVTVDSGDITRARTRADLLERFGFRALAAAGGRKLADGVATAAQAMDVHLIIDAGDDADA